MMRSATGGKRRAPLPARTRRLANAVAFAGAVLGAGALATAASTTHTVVIDGTRYDPAVLKVKKGDTVRWVDKDPFPHTVTARGAFDSHEIGAGRSWKYVARKPGRYDYVCTLHPNMKGTLIVQ